MNIREAVRPDLIFLDLEAGNAEDALAVVARELADNTKLGADLVRDALLEREELGSTSVGNGFAIPHCKLANLDHIVVALARFDRGIGFGSGKNGAPVQFFFVVLSPPDQPTEHLQILSQIARVLKNSDLRDELLAAADPDGVVDSVNRAADLEGL